MTLDDSYREMCLEVEALRASLERKVRHCDEITEERDQMQRERDEARLQLAGLPAWQHACEQSRRDLAHAEEAIARLYTERDEARAELSTLRKDYDSVLEANVGLLDDAPWADVRRAYIRGAEAMRLACQQWCRAWENNGEAIADALADLRVEDKP